ncbi:hypothetical protein [Kitasatospora sp. NPDC087315]|uniref:hypothetical protein n=1 Tax=Kitasatospora sp. NPDC087315 TaxID=3364069 RepID=UPI00382CE8FE
MLREGQARQGDGVGGGGGQRLVVGDVFTGEDFLEITFRKGPWKPDVVISLSGLRHVSVDKPPQIAGSFIDEISLIHLPQLPRPWPADASGGAPPASAARAPVACAATVPA